MWTLFWVAVGIGIIILLILISIVVAGRGHLGAKQSESHYLDEVEARSRFPWG